MGLTVAQNLDPRTIHVRQQAVWRGIFTWEQPANPPTDPVTYVPGDVAGYSARFRWLKKPGGETLVTVVSPDTVDGGIDIDEVTATFVVHLCATDTGSLTADGCYVLDLVADDDPCEVVPLASGWANLILVGETYPAVV